MSHASGRPGSLSVGGSRSLCNCAYRRTVDENRAEPKAHLPLARRLSVVGLLFDHECHVPERRNHCPSPPPPPPPLPPPPPRPPPGNGRARAIGRAVRGRGHESKRQELAGRIVTSRSGFASRTPPRRPEFPRAPVALMPQRTSQFSLPPSPAFNFPPMTLITRRRFAFGSAAALGAAALGDAFLVEPTAIDASRQDVPVPGLPPALEGVRIASLSDVHLSNQSVHRAARAALEVLARERPEV